MKLPWTFELRSMFPVRKPPVRGPVDQMAAKVALSAGLCSVQAEIVCLAVLAAVAGRSRLLKGPASALHGAFHVLGVSSGQAQAENLLFGLPFQVLAAQVRADVLQRQPSSPLVENREATLLQDIGKLEAEVREIQADQRKFEPPPEGWDALAYLTEQRASKGRTPPLGTPDALAYRYFQAVTRINEARGALGELRRRNKPLALTEGVPVDEVVRAREWAFEETVSNLDSSGTTIASLDKAGKRSAERFLGLLAASFDGRPFLESGKEPCLPMVTHAGRVDRTQLGALLSRGPAGAGWLRGCVVLDLAAGRVGEVDLATAFRPVPGFTKTIKQLFEDRLTGYAASHSLSGEAIAVLQQFTRELDRISAAEPDATPFLERWPELAMKMALLLHLGTSPDETMISREAMARAAGLLVAAGADGVALLADLAVAPFPVTPGAAVDTLVEKIRRKGPLTRRDLCRTYHDQRSSSLAPALESALAQGLVVKRDGLLFAG